MRRFVIIMLALTFCLVSAGVVKALEYTHNGEWIGLDAGPLNSKFGIRIGDLKVKFDAEGLNFLRYRVTPRQGDVRLVEMEVMVDGKVAYKETDKKPLNIEMHYFEGNKHFQDILFFDKPVKGFTVEKGEIRWTFTAGDKTYYVTWNINENEVKTTVAEPQAKQ